MIMMIKNDLMIIKIWNSNTNRRYICSRYNIWFETMQCKKMFYKVWISNIEFRPPAYCHSHVTFC